MPTAKRFEDLEIWNDSIQLAKEIYLLTQRESFKQDFDLKNQIRRATVSISNNIAEGFEYNCNNSFIRFLKIAKGSCGEVRSMIILMNEINYMNATEKNRLYLLTSLLSKRIGSLLNYLSQNKEKERTILK